MTLLSVLSTAVKKGYEHRQERMPGTKFIVDTLEGHGLIASVCSRSEFHSCGRKLPNRFLSAIIYENTGERELKTLKDLSHRLLNN